MNTFSTALLVVSTLVALAGLVSWILGLMRRPHVSDPTPGSGSSRRGIIYAFTSGMLPWNKESTRMHWLDYVRGILFHAGIFGGLLTLTLTPWWNGVPPPLRIMVGVALAIGFIGGLLGLWARFSRPNLRAMSRPDDYISPVLVTAFIANAAAFASGLVSREIFYLSASVMLLYLPVSKVRHSVYFFHSRIYFGGLFGHRGVIGQPHGLASKGDTNG
jgi:hypothetical protein